MWVADDPARPPLRVRRVVPRDVPLTAMGWPIDPDAMTESLLDVARVLPGLPLVVTESGAAFDDVADAAGLVDDGARLGYHAAHIAATARAIAAGADVRGYFCWSLLDNFEWADGLSRRFGLVRVDESLGRTLKASGRWYADLCARQRERHP